MHNNTTNTYINEFTRFFKTSVIQCLMPLIFNGINAGNTMRGLPFSPLIKFLAVLRFYGTQFASKIIHFITF